MVAEGGGPAGEEQEELKGYLWMCSARREEVGGGLSTASGGRWRRRAVVEVFQRGRRGEAGLGGYGGRRGSCWGV